MEQEQSQPNSDMTPEEAKASLGIATYLQGQLLPQGEPSPDEGVSENARGGEEKQDVGQSLQEMELRLKDEIMSIKEMIKENSPEKESKEIDALKKEIEDVLNSDDK